MTAPTRDDERITESILADIETMARIMLAGSIPPMPPIKHPGLPFDE